MGKIFCLMGKSATGKDTIYSRLLSSSLNLRPIIPYTTRPIREGEVNGREYHFTDNDFLSEMTNKGCVIEKRSYNTVCGLWNYFTLDDGQIEIDRYNYIYIGTLDVYKSFVDYFGSQYIVPIYIEVDDYLRLRRALDREKQQKVPKYAELCRRYLGDEADFNEETLTVLGINRRFNNIDLENTVKNISDYICKNI